MSLDNYIEQIVAMKLDPARNAEIEAATEALTKAHKDYQDLLLSKDNEIAELLRNAASAVKKSPQLLQEVQEWSLTYTAEDEQLISAQFDELAPRFPYILKKYVLAVALGQLNRVVYRTFVANTYAQTLAEQSLKDRTGIEHFLNELDGEQ